RRRLRALRAPRLPPARAVRLGLLDHDRVQLPDAAVAVVAAAQDEPARAVRRIAADPGRYVDGAVHHHRDLAEPGLPALELAHLRADLGGLVAARGQHLVLPAAVPAVPALRAVHPDQRGQAPAPRAGAGGGAACRRLTWYRRSWRSSARPTGCATRPRGC